MVDLLSRAASRPRLDGDVAPAPGWLAWIVAIYELGANFILLSWAAGLLAAILVGMLIVPLMLRWRELAGRDAADLV